MFKLTLSTHGSYLKTPPLKTCFLFLGEAGRGLIHHQLVKNQDTRPIRNLADHYRPSCELFQDIDLSQIIDLSDNNHLCLNYLIP